MQYDVVCSRTLGGLPVECKPALVLAGISHTAYQMLFRQPPRGNPCNMELFPVAFKKEGRESFYDFTYKVSPGTPFVWLVDRSQGTHSWIR